MSAQSFYFLLHNWINKMIYYLCDIQNPGGIKMENIKARNIVNRKVSINRLRYFLDAMYIAEKENLIDENNLVDLEELKNYDGSIIGGRKFNFDLVLFAIDDDYSRYTVNDSRIINSKNYGSRILDKFVINDFKIINGIIDEEQSIDFFIDLQNLLNELNVKKCIFISLNDPGLDSFKVIKRDKIFNGDKYFVLEYYNENNSFSVPKKLYCCETCDNIYKVTNMHKKYLKERNLKIPKHCSDCLEKRKNNEYNCKTN